MKVLVTGAAGYIGSTLCRRLLADGCEVVGIDNLLHGGGGLLGLLQFPAFTFLKEDIATTTAYEDLLDPQTNIVHLAAIVGEPASRKLPEATVATNREATTALIDLAARKNVQKFIFASTCSNYGSHPEGAPATETCELKPLSLYAETKVAVERYLHDAHGTDLNWTILRFATVYGVSPRLRLDLTVNDFTAHALVDKKLVVFLPESTRPYIHVVDVARAVQHVLANGPPTAHDIFNVGNTRENYRKIRIVNAIKEIVGDFEVELVEKGNDPRDYRVDFEKIRSKLDYHTTRTVPDGIREIALIVTTGIVEDITKAEYHNS